MCLTRTFMARKKRAAKISAAVMLSLVTTTTFASCIAGLQVFSK